MTTLAIGVAGGGVLRPDNTVPDLDTQFAMVREAGVFDYVERTPPPGEVDAYRAASERHAMPIRAGGFYYALGRDDDLLAWHLRIGRDLGATVHNVQLFTHHANGHAVTNDEVAEFYLRAVEIGERTGVTPCLEIHVNMWSEHFGRVAEVGSLVERRGVPFRLTLDHSHVVFKIDNPAEQDVQGMRADIEAGRVVLDPADPACVAYEWISRNWVRHAHARAAAPAGPPNVWAHHPDGRVGRGIQYPFVRPEPGQWHSAWDEARLKPWQRIMRALLDHHARDAASPLELVSTEFIPFPDYGAGAGYSIFAQNVACAVWLREQWRQACHTP